MSQRFFSREVVVVAIVATLLVAVSVMPPWSRLTAQNVDAEAMRLEADQAFAGEQWEDAAERYQRLSQMSDAFADGAIWFRLGYALHAQGKLDEAMEAHRAAAGYSRFAPTAFYNLACAFALKGNSEHALNYLKRAVEIGFYSPRPIEEDPDFRSLKTDPRFKVLAIKAREKKSYDLYRELDFWVGDWQVVDVNGEQVGLCEVTRRERGFAIIQQWTGEDEATGTSLSYVDPETRRWRQTWVDQHGNVNRFQGEWDGDKMVFRGTMQSIRGDKTLAQMTLKPMEDGRIHHVFQVSIDDGETWVPHYDGYYQQIGSNSTASSDTGSNSTEKKDTPQADSNKTLKAEARQVPALKAESIGVMPLGGQPDAESNDTESNDTESNDTESNDTEPNDTKLPEANPRESVSVLTGNEA